MFRLLAALMAVFVLAAPGEETIRFTAAKPAVEQHRTVRLDTIRQVICLVPPAPLPPNTPPTPELLLTMDVQVGTGTIVAPDRVLTAQHVINGAFICMVGMDEAVVTYQDADLDVAVLAVKIGPSFVTPIACDGFSTNQRYLAIGYAHGDKFSLEQLTFTGVVTDTMATSPDGKTVRRIPTMSVFRGPTVGGMSGGPVLGGDGRLYGIINASAGARGELSAFRDLSKTPVCRDPKVLAALPPLAPVPNPPVVGPPPLSVDTPIKTAP